VEGADLLVEYESKKAAFLRRQEASGDDAANDENDIQEEPMNDEVDGDEWEEVDEEGDEVDGEEWEEVEGEGEDEGDNDSDDGSAPALVLLKSDQASDDAPVDEDELVVDLSKMTPEEREDLKQKVSSTRVFTASDFEKMRKLVEREHRAKRDPREAARRKRAVAKGKEFEELSDDSDSDADDHEVRVSGVVTPQDIMADAKRKRQSKAEKLEKIVAGRQKFESKSRAGGSTNTEKKRKKNFMMSQFSFATRSKGKGKATAMAANKRKQLAGTHEAKKRRRKM
jgi:protein SDA1